MDNRRMGAFDLAVYAGQLKEFLVGGQLGSLDEPTRSALIAAFGTLPDELSARASEARTAEEIRKSKISAKNATKSEVLGRIALLRDALKANRAPADEMALCGFDHPPRRSTYVALDPTGLSVTGTSNGVNTLRFSGNNAPARVIYEISRRESKSDRWAVVAVTKKQTFVDSGVTPGAYYQYKVRAVAAKTVSNFSNTAVIGKAPA